MIISVNIRKEVSRQHWKLLVICIQTLVQSSTVVRECQLESKTLILKTLIYCHKLNDAMTEIFYYYM
jgi:hypothetical protein